MIRRGPRPWVIDWAGRPLEPAVGDIVRRLTPTLQVSFWIVTGVRKMVPRRPLPDGYIARYRITVDALKAEPTHVDWESHSYARKRRPGRVAPDADPFSPLL